MITAKELYYTHHDPRKYEDKKNVVYLCKKIDSGWNSKSIDSFRKELSKEFYKRINTYNYGLILFERFSFGIFAVCKVTIGSKIEQVYRELGFKEES